jgi:hypothetical protein
VVAEISAPRIGVLHAAKDAVLIVRDRRSPFLSRRRPTSRDAAQTSAPEQTHCHHGYADDEQDLCEMEEDH